MSNRSDFVISSPSLEKAEEMIRGIVPLFSEQVEIIKKASEELVDTENWKGKARDEFHDTYLIVEHYLHCDKEQMSSILDIITGFKDIYEAVDADSAVKLIKTVKGD